MAYPGQNAPELPDYYCGQLIWKEEGNSLAWCVYDGNQIDRFQTRELAERFALARHGTVTDDCIGRLMQIYYRINTCNQALHREAGIAPPPFNISLEKISARLAHQRDELDKIISQMLNKVTHV
jgi:hypothetical protein